MAFERDINLKIINEVAKFEYLYNSNLPEYSKKDITERAWHKVSKKINLSVHDCKDKWKNIRSAFVRSLKPTANGPHPKSRKPYYLHDHLLFILPHVKHVKNRDMILKNEVPTKDGDTIIYDDESESSLGPISNDDNQSENGSTSPSLPSSETRKKFKPNTDSDEMYLKYLDKKDNTNQASDEETAKRYFLLSLLPEVKGLNEEQMRHFKIQVLLLIDGIKGNSSTGQQPSGDRTEPPYSHFMKPDPSSSFQS